MIIVTGGAGFIGSVFVWKLNEEGVDDILIVDELGESEKWKTSSSGVSVITSTKNPFSRWSSPTRSRFR